MSALAAVLLAVTVHGAPWTATPDHPTVGDTVWLERTVAVPAGWRVRPSRFEATANVEPLADPALERLRDGWRLRYAVVAWTPGVHRVRLPSAWLIGPSGRTDSLPGGVAELTIASVLPQHGAVAPQPALAPMRIGRRWPWAPAIALVLAAAGLVGGWRWRRRPPRTVAPAPPLRPAPPGADAQWLEAGEPRAVVARARAQLRSAVARAVPAAHEALTTVECLAVVARERPDLARGELQETLTALESAAFAGDMHVDAAPLAARARAAAARIGA